MQPNRKPNPVVIYQDSQVLMAKNIGRIWADYFGQYGEYCAECLLLKFKLDEVSREINPLIPVKNYIGFMVAARKTPTENGIIGGEFGILVSDFD